MDWKLLTKAVDALVRIAEGLEKMHALALEHGPAVSAFVKSRTPPAE